MTALLCKELRLAAHPTLFLFLFMGALVLIPAYPYGMVVFFGCLALFFTFQNARENKDTFYSAVLPVKKKAVVGARCLLVALFQLTQLLLSVPFACLRPLLHAQGNPVGMNANVAFFGFAFVLYGLFNVTFLPIFYMTAYRLGRAFIWGLVPLTLGIFLMEAVSHIPALGFLNRTDGAALLRQLPILAAGVLLYVLSTAAAFHLSAKRFERVDL